METAVLANSARRCALCFHLNGDLTEKLGQIAHLDGDRSNGQEDNLAWMCLGHHSVFDSTTRQHKNYTIAEVKSARSKLHKLVGEGKHLTPAAALPYLQAEADKKVLRDLLEGVPSNRSIQFLRSHDFAGSFRRQNLEDIRLFFHKRDGPEHEFLDPTLERARQKFRKCCLAFLETVAQHAFLIEGQILIEGQENLSILGVPRDWRFRNPTLFKTAVEEIHTTAEAVCRTYDKLVRLARQKLAFYEVIH